MTAEASPSDRDDGPSVDTVVQEARRSSSPYSTGGGGVTFERRVAARYLALLLSGAGAPELGDGRVIGSVAFQSDSAVDDLVVEAARLDEAESALVLAIGIRRAPHIVPSSEDTQKLITTFMQSMRSTPAGGREHRLALVVAGPQDHAAQLAELAYLATDQKSAAAFHQLITAPGRFRRQLVDRLGCLEGLVRGALKRLDGGPVPDDEVGLRTWELLLRLSVLMPRLEPPDLTDWTTVANQLVPFARGRELAAAVNLRDRLEVLAGRYAPGAAVVNLSLLRRDVHPLLEPEVSHRPESWARLRHLEDQAVATVRTRLGPADRSDGLRLNRQEAKIGLLAALTEQPAGLVIEGESGIGKSTLALETVRDEAHRNPEQFQAVCLNLRHLPATSLQFRVALGCPFRMLLDELSAPHRFLVVDGADAVIESHAAEEMFVHLVAAAADSAVSVVAVTAGDSRQVVTDLLTQNLSGTVTSFGVQGLSDSQLNEVTAHFPELRRLVDNPRSRKLLRRLVVVDLLVRSRATEVPLSDLEAMQQVWTGLVRRHERSDHGRPDARQQVLLELAAADLTGVSPLELASRLDAAAIEGLRHDGLLRPASVSSWEVVPAFAHDEIRRYAVARVLLASGDPVAALAAAGAPRWALSASKLACQALLKDAESPNLPMKGRLDAVQSKFDGLVKAGHGSRWGDVPSEAVLTLDEPSPLIADAWPALLADNRRGLLRLLRLVDQRHRDEAKVLDRTVAEPIVCSLLNEPRPWEVDNAVADFLLEWLLALTLDEAPAGAVLRTRLASMLVAACAEGQERLSEQQERAKAAWARRTKKEIEEEEAFHRRLRQFDEASYGGRRRRVRAELPRELTTDTVLGLLALLGPDLSEEGEELLRRVARDAPWHLTKALEGAGAGRALATHSVNLLAELIEAYYIDEDGGGSFLDDGIRRHSSRGFLTPLAAFYRGPFFALFQGDLRQGVRTLNRMLNHAAIARARSLNRHSLDRAAPASEDEVLDEYRTELRVTGSPVKYVGDEQVWLWYRGTGVGPYPCMSALQAMERVVDAHIAAGTAIGRLVRLLTDGCENLATLGLIVGLLIRHLDRADAFLDPYLTEPVIWHLEFTRQVSETSGLAAKSAGMMGAERRAWGLREAATYLTLKAEGDRIDELKAVGDELVSNARRQEQEAGLSDSDFVSTVRNWASALNRASFRAYASEGQVYVQSEPPPDVAEVLQPRTEDMRRGHEAMRLQTRYLLQARTRGEFPPYTTEELSADLSVARDLLDDPPAQTAVEPISAAVDVSAVALRCHFLEQVLLTGDDLGFAIEIVLGVAEQDIRHRADSEISYFDWGPDRVAARALPILLLPQAAEEGCVAAERVRIAGLRMAGALAIETRLHLARGLDPLWSEPCQADGACHHKVALGIATETVRDCALGDWHQASQQRLTVRVDDPLPAALAVIRDESVYVAKLDALIRACGAAVGAATCVTNEARELLLACVELQTRGLLHEPDYDERGSSALVTARALLSLATASDDRPILQQVAICSNKAALLARFLRALAAAAEESPAAAETARRIWPAIMTTVLDQDRPEHRIFLTDHHYGRYALAALIPVRTYDEEFLYRELSAEPIEWRDVVAWRPQIERWLATAAGERQCVDALAAALESLPVTDQVEIGLPWLQALVIPDSTASAVRSRVLATWLVNVRQTASDTGRIGAWQELVDALVVAGDTTLAPYSE